MSWNPQDYAKHSRGQEVWAKELMAQLALKGDESILDIGCGDGRITDMLARATSGKTVGIDANTQMIAHAASQYTSIEFAVMDAQKLDFEKRFDVVFSNAALHWVRDHDAVVRGIYRALKPDGRMILQMGGAGNAKEVFAALERTCQAYAACFEAFESPYTFCSDIYYDGLLKTAGFSHYSAELIEKEMVHERVEAFEGWLRTTWFPYIERVPKIAQADFVAMWMANYLERRGADAAGNVHVDMVRLEVKAQK